MSLGSESALPGRSQLHSDGAQRPLPGQRDARGAGGGQDAARGSGTLARRKRWVLGESTGLHPYPWSKKLVIELDDGENLQENPWKTLYLMVKTMVSCRFSLKPIHWIGYFAIKRGMVIRKWIEWIDLRWKRDSPCVLTTALIGVSLKMRNLPQMDPNGNFTAKWW